MRQSIQVPTGSLDVRGPFGQDLQYGAAHPLPSPLVHEIRRSGLAIARLSTAFARSSRASGSGPTPALDPDRADEPGVPGDGDRRITVEPWPGAGSAGSRDLEGWPVRRGEEAAPERCDSGDD